MNVYGTLHQKLQNNHPLQARMDHFQKLTLICKDWALMHTLSPLVITKLWNSHLGWKSSICPSRLTLPHSLSCSMSCEVDKYWVYSQMPFSSSFWLSPSSGRQEQRLLGERRVESGHLLSLPPPCGVAEDGCYIFPAAPSRLHSLDSCPFQGKYPFFPLLPLRSRGGNGPCYS